MSVAQAERLFATEISVFTSASQKGLRLTRASTPYSLPADVADAVYVVGDLVGLPHTSMLRKNIVKTPAAVEAPAAWPKGCPTLTRCGTYVTPAVLKQRYTVTDTEEDVKANAAASMAVAEFQGQEWDPTDLQKFSTACGVNVTVDRTIGTNKPSSCELNPNACVESLLDIEYIKGLSSDIPLTVVYSATYSLLNWAEQIQQMEAPPAVHSVSYGNDEKQQISKAFMQSCNVQFMKAGTRGISILFASGDQGVCGREGCGLFEKRFKPDFPGGSPYITVVGGTDFATPNVIGDETTWSDGGGGFSDNFAIPSWQSEVVAGYKTKATAAGTLPKASLFNNTGRGYPDVAALAGQKNPYCIVTAGEAAGVAGTSAASPVVASIFARLNGLQLAAGNSALGFLNPFIYSLGGKGFHDVTTGSNPGQGNKDGFTAMAGWDPATGWGTPDYTALKALLP
jgi:tripeptidyl-peptidase-1